MMTVLGLGTDLVNQGAGRSYGIVFGFVGQYYWQMIWIVLTEADES